MHLARIAVFGFAILATFGVADAEGLGPTVATTQSAAGGSWDVSAAGWVTPKGGASFHGDLRAQHIASPIVAIVGSATGQGYWLITGTGGVFKFGDAPYLGSAGSIRLDKPIVAAARTPSGRGYYLVDSSGGVFAFGDARFYGPSGNDKPGKTIAAIHLTPSGRGYDLVASDGTLFPYGDALKTVALPEPKPVTIPSCPSNGPAAALFASVPGYFFWANTPRLDLSKAVSIVCYDKLPKGLRVERIVPPGLLLPLPK